MTSDFSFFDSFLVGVGAKNSSLINTGKHPQRIIS
nr:MAG TPA: hypothetical protein [Caudoviricetes sp.]